MANTSPIPVRLDAGTITRLDAAAKRIGSNRAAVMRLLVEQWLEHYEAEGMAMLPVDWKEIVRQLDGRTQRYAKKPEISSPTNKAKTTKKKEPKE